jgi:hypothetical protein
VKKERHQSQQVLKAQVEELREELVSERRRAEQTLREQKVQ